MDHWWRMRWLLELNMGILPDSSFGKESTCNAGDPGSVLELGRAPGEGIGYPLQYSWTSLVAQLVKNLPAMQETLVQFLGWEDLLEKGKAIHSSILAWRIPWTIQFTGSQRVIHDWRTFTFILLYNSCIFILIIISLVTHDSFLFKTVTL